MTLDLSAVTDSLIGLVKGQWTTAPIWTEVGGSPPGPTFTPNFTGLAPDAVRQQPGPQLSMYLYHVEPDNAREALFWQPQMLDAAGGEPTRFLPLALDLFYLLFAYSETSYTEEQEAMSVALRIFHANPIVRSDPGAAVPWELTLTMEHRSYDELSRLWQATTAPLRMSVVYRAAVVFIDPDPMPAPAPDDLVVLCARRPRPAAIPAPARATTRSSSARSATAPTSDRRATVPFSQSPATVAAGQTIWLMGSDLGATGVSDSVYLLPPAGGAEEDVTAWAVAADSSAAKFVLALPAAAGAGTRRYPRPWRLPAPGRAAARWARPAPRAAARPRSASPRDVEPLGRPGAGRTRPRSRSTGTGFVPGATEVLVGAGALTEITAPPGPGEVSIGPSGTSFSFSPPAGPAGMVAPVRVRVNGIESDPALWVTL